MKKIINFINSIEKDKLLHSYISCIIYMICNGISKCIFLSAMITFSIGIAKEFIDIIHYGFKDQDKDSIADVGGIILGIILAVIQ